MGSARASLLLVACVLWLAPCVAPAHELPGNRATLVLRDNHHLTLTLHVGFPELLFQALGSGNAFGPFLLEYSTMAPERFAKELRRAQAAVEHGTRVYLQGGRDLVLTRWSWPDATTGQALLRERVMREAVGGGDDHHGEPMEIRAEAVAAEEVHSVSIEFPAILRRVLVVAYRPTQVWVDAGTRSAAIAF
jgi:hypothetical protein